MRMLQYFIKVKSSNSVKISAKIGVFWELLREFVDLGVVRFVELLGGWRGAARTTPAKSVRL